MENEIKVGEYIRTKLGDIKKITEGFEFIIEIHNKSYNKIVKHSPNIIDLIEVGDYVNRWYVIGIYEDRIHTEFDDFFEEDIKTIVTKEQFESISYKVKQEEN